MTTTAKMEKKTVKDVPNKVIGSLAESFGKSVDTIKRWFEKDHLILTTPKAKEIFESEGFDFEAFKQNAQ